LVDRLQGRADQLHAVALEDPLLRQRLGQVQGGLAAHGGQQGVRPLAGDDLLRRLHRDRLHVGAVRQVRVGHHRRRVGVEEDDLHALLAQRLDRLGPRVVELASLTDHDRPRADHQHLPDIRTLGHGRRAMYRRPFTFAMSSAVRSTPRTAAIAVLLMGAMALAQPAAEADAGTGTGAGPDAGTPPPSPPPPPKAKPDAGSAPKPDAGTDAGTPPP